MNVLNRTTIRFTVYGKPEPAGSKNSFVPLNKTTKEPFRNSRGGVVVSTVESNPKSKSWKGAIAAAAAAQMGPMPLLRGALSVEFRFYVPRPMGHYGSGKNAGIVKGSAPKWPTVKPDVLKLARAVEDAMTKVAWLDDCQIVVERLVKAYGEPARVEITITEL